MALLSRDQILKADDLKHEDVEVPEWGGTVRVRALTGLERDKFEESTVEQKGKNTRMNLLNLRARLVALTAIDESGNNVFSPEDVKALGNKNAGALDRVFAVASRLSGMSQQDVEDLTEGFDDGPSDDSTSA